MTHTFILTDSHSLFDDMIFSDNEFQIRNILIPVDKASVDILRVRHIFLQRQLHSRQVVRNDILVSVFLEVLFLLSCCLAGLVAVRNVRKIFQELLIVV